VWVASPVADALARLGRWDDIDTLYNRASRVWTLGSDANALNIIANRGRYRFYRGDSLSALRDLDAAIADAANRTGEVSAGALASMHFYRACALHSMQRNSEAIRSLSIAMRPADPVASANLYLCLGRHEAARSLLVNALRHEELRDSVLGFVQPEAGPPLQSETAALLLARQRALREDPILLAEAAKYGRILPWTISASAPAEQGGR
jgi:tetratricopeptide (TPR) repeat protein